jgi:hypothetical protein
MRTIIKRLAIAAAMAIPTLVLAATPGAGLIGTRHDFASRAAYMATQTDGAGVANPAVNSVGLCSYCHTPHSAISTSLLWNHTLSAATFTWDEAATSGGTGYASITPAYKGPSVKCLSCHDGSVAIGDVALYMEGPAVFNTLKITMGDAANIGAKGGVAGAMGGNHPIAMPYPLGNAGSTYNTKTTGAAVVLTEFVAAPENTNATKVKLYSDNGSGAITAGGSAGKAGIECSSCHDVHNKASVEDLFLRGKIAGSTAASGYLCLQCHIK